MSQHTTIFADGILDANVTYGVARLTLAQSGPDGKPIPAGQLAIPLMQLPAFANGLLNLLKQVETRVKEQQAQGGQAGAPAGGQGTAPGAAEGVPSSFRFG